MSVLGPIVGKKASTPATVGRGEDDAVQLELARRTWTESTGPADRQADRQRPVLPKPLPPLRNRGPATAEHPSTKRVGPRCLRVGRRTGPGGHRDLRQRPPSRRRVDHAPREGRLSAAEAIPAATPVRASPPAPPLPAASPQPPQAASP